MHQPHIPFFKKRHILYKLTLVLSIISVCKAAPTCFVKNVLPKNRTRTGRLSSFQDPKCRGRIQKKQQKGTYSKPCKMFHYKMSGFLGPSPKFETHRHADVLFWHPKFLSPSSDIPITTNPSFSKVDSFVR